MYNKKKKKVNTINKDMVITNLQELKHIPSNAVDYNEILSGNLEYDENGKCINAFKILSCSESLRLSYNSLKSNPGNMVPGSDKQTFDGLTWEWFHNTQKTLFQETYSPKPARRVYIPKPNGKKRPLGIASPRDKIVQQSLKLILEHVLEPKFSDLSHGFRPNRGCQTALREIRRWGGVPWLIEGDIKGFFDNIDHHILESLLKKHFNETRFFNLYWKLVKAGYVEWDTNKIKLISTDVGVPQGSIIGPILSNLVLHELDLYVEELMKKLEDKRKGIVAYKTNPKYHSLVNRNYLLKKKIEKLIDKKIDTSELRKEYTENIKKRNKIKSTIHNPDYTKISYVRYADDWVLGVWGTHKMATNLKHLIGDFLDKLKLTLSYEKTKITSTKKSRAKFLSTYITRIASNHCIRMRTNSAGRRVRIANGNLWMTAPISEIIKKLIDKGFLICNNSRFRFLRIPQFTALPARDIILRYRSIYNGLINYYSFVDNKKQFLKIQWILKESLIKTLMNKHNCGKHDILKKYGKNITIAYKTVDKKDKQINFEFDELKRTPMNFMIYKARDPFESLKYKISSRNLFNSRCVNCNSIDKIEMHHIKHIKTINTKLSEFDKMVASINRKQVPLCKVCHIKIHTGEYRGVNLKKVA